MDLQEALKQVRAKKPKENLLLISIAWNKKLIFPYSEGMAFLAALKNAELIEESYGKPTQILRFERDTMTANALSYEEYEDLKVAQLLDITMDALKQARVAQTEAA